MSELRDQIRLLVADRHSPEARALFLTLLKYVDRRVRSVGRIHASDLLSSSELEELVADVMLQLMAGSLAQFRGDSLPELMAYVRTVSDRRVWRIVKRRIRERRTLESMENELHRPWGPRGDSPERLVAMVPDLPLSDNDEDYLRALLRAGSKAALAREQSLSRAAVTQRVQRIRSRISSLSPNDQLAVEAWLQQAAREVLSEPG